jgi:hypothetical protein
MPEASLKSYFSASNPFFIVNHNTNLFCPDSQPSLQVPKERFRWGGQEEGRRLQAEHYCTRWRPVGFIVTIMDRLVY